MHQTVSVMSKTVADQTDVIRDVACSAGLKEWSVTCRALEEGRQIILLRKGGIHDAEGVFELEHNIFWLLPTYLHQDETLVKPEHRDLFREDAAAQATPQKCFALRSLARVEQVFTVAPENEAKLMRAGHIWSEKYLEGRFD